MINERKQVWDNTRIPTQPENHFKPSWPELRLIERMHESLEELRRLPDNPPGHAVEIIDDIEEGLRRLDRLQRELSVSPEESMGSRSGSILVVDGSETDAASTAAILEDLGWCVQATSTGEEALEVLAQAERLPYCVWLEAMLGQSSSSIAGMDLLQRLSELYPTLPLVMLTSFHSTEGAFEAGKSGASGYYGKPLTKRGAASILEEVAKTKGYESANLDRAESRRFSQFLRERLAERGGVKRLSRETGLDPEHVEVCLARGDGVRIVDMVLLLSGMGVSAEELCERVCREVPPAVAQERRMFRAVEALIRQRLQPADDRYLAGVLGIGRNELSRCLLGDDPRWFQAVLASAHYGNVGLEELLDAAFPATFEVLT